MDSNDWSSSLILQIIPNGQLLESSTTRKYGTYLMNPPDPTHPILQNAGYTTIYRTGHCKKHGLLIAYRDAKCTKVSDHIIFFDEKEVQDDRRV